MAVLWEELQNLLNKKKPYYREIRTMRGRTMRGLPVPTSLCGQKILKSVTARLSMKCTKDMWTLYVLYLIGSQFHKVYVIILDFCICASIIDTICNAFCTVKIYVCFKNENFLFICPCVWSMVTLKDWIDGFSISLIDMFLHTTYVRGL